MMKTYPPIDLDTSFWHGEGQTYCIGDFGYSVESLWEAAKDLPTYEVPLIGFCTDIAPWTGVGDDFKTFLIHAKLCNDADLSYPIILDPAGNIADGRHRLGKAILMGLNVIQVKRLAHMPDPAYTFDNDGVMTPCSED